MTIEAAGGAGGTGFYENGGAGGSAGNAGSPTGNGNGTGGATGDPGGDGSTAGVTSAGTGGGGGSDGDHAAGGRGGDAGTQGNHSVGGGGGGGGGIGQFVSFSGGVNSSQGGTGGAGGAGGPANASGATDTGQGGGGGNGGSGLALRTSKIEIVVVGATTIVGGTGGQGGAGSVGSNNTYGIGGKGGNGGAGIDAGDSNAVVNGALIEGGLAGFGGFGGVIAYDGPDGVSGVGITGSNLTISNSGEIEGGGFASNDYQRGDAIDFTGGSNVLYLGSGNVAGTIIGNVSVIGSLDVLPGVATASLSGGNLVFGAAGAVVTIESGVTLKDDIGGFAPGDTLDLKAVAYSSALEAVFTASATGGSLRIVNAAHPTNVVASLTLTGAYTSGVFGMSSDGSNGTKISFTSTPPLGMQPNDTATSNIPGSSALVVVDRYNADYSLYQEDTVTKASNGNYTFHFQNGSFFNGKTFQSFDNVTNSAGLLLNQTLYDGAGFAYQQTQFNANGSIYLQDQASKPASGQVLYHYANGSFFTGRPYSAFDNLATNGGTLLDQILYNNDGSHTFTVPGSNLALTAQKKDTFNVSGQNDTTRFNATGFGADTFNGYKPGDIFSFSTSIFANYQALQQHLSGTSSAVITTSANDTLTLANVAKSSVTAGMFAFT